jgi:hypothetical protein
MENRRNALRPFLTDTFPLVGPAFAWTQVPGHLAVRVIWKETRTDRRRAAEAHTQHDEIKTNLLAQELHQAGVLPPCLLCRVRKCTAVTLSYFLDLLLKLIGDVVTLADDARRNAAPPHLNDAARCDFPHCTLSSFPQPPSPQNTLAHVYIHLYPSAPSAAPVPTELISFRKLLTGAGHRSGFVAAVALLDVFHACIEFVPLLRFLNR